MEFDELLKGLKSDLREKVKKPKSDEEDFYLVDAIGKVIEGKGLKPDLRNPEVIKILEGSSGEIVQSATREIWKHRKSNQRAEKRETTAGIDSDDPKVVGIQRYAPEIASHESDKAALLYELNLLIPGEIEELRFIEENEDWIDRTDGKHSAKVKKFLIMHDEEKLSPEEVAKQLNLPLATVRKRMETIKKRGRRGREFLKKLIVKRANKIKSL